MPAGPDRPDSSAALSLLELRRHLLRRAGKLQARANDLHIKGANTIAARLRDESDRLRSMAQTMADDDEG